LKRLVEGGVGLLVSLIESKDGYLPDEWMQQAGIQQLKLPLRDHTVPTMDNVKTFLDAARKTIASGKAVTVHCLRGCGRTAVFLACYLVVERRYHPERAIDKIKAVQPEAFSTLQQELYVWDVWRELVPEDDS
jgi:protein-tyrosine phosphatase